MRFSENLSQAVRSVRANLLRAILTLMIIATGIMALVGILTAIDALLFTMNDSFSGMGANSFNIIPGTGNLHSNRHGRQEKEAEPIDFRQAMDFKERFDYPGSKVSISGLATWDAILKFGKEKTNPTVLVYGVDDQYLDINGYDLLMGRNFTNLEQEAGTLVTIIGMDIVNDLFDKKPISALNKVITIDNRRFTVIGILASKGASMNRSADRRVLIPLFAERYLYGNPDKNYDITVSEANPAEIDDAISLATGVMRNIRKLRASQENDFEALQSDSLLKMIKENTATIRIATIGIGFITLIGAAIGLMNIMLVSVTERTREIGINKALGATRANILNQFLTEAVMICQMGGIVGIILGVGIGLGVSAALGGKFHMPWAWITLGFVTCMIVGLVAGLYPALKAARLDPIESLRYE
ncbi:MAG TPA: ABC transporter permease [Saprospiraceae bacterium]|nr:ABC transporter permease [Saprospiraceae bacterium]